MNSIKQKILSFLLKEFYLFWTAGLTIGIYIGSRHYYYNPHIFTVEAVFILLMLILEVILIRRLSIRFPLGSSFVSSSAKLFQPDSERNFLKFSVLMVIPFFFYWSSEIQLSVYINTAKVRKFYYPYPGTEIFAVMT